MKPIIEMEFDFDLFVTDIHLDAKYKDLERITLESEIKQAVEDALYFFVKSGDLSFQMIENIKKCWKKRPLHTFSML